MSLSAQELSNPARGSVPDPLPTAKEIDASCRWPVFCLFLTAATWFALSGVLGLLVSIKLHSSGFLASWPWLTYGRIRPVQMDALMYGFAVPAALGVILWLFCRLGQTRLVAPAVLLIATKLWNLGLVIGSVGILAGDSTGFEWLEYPRYAVPWLLVAYALVGIWAVLTFHARRTPALFPSQWYLLAALFWFAWIYSAATMLLVFSPVQGALQISTGAWFSSNLLNVWLSSVGLGVIFYFLPKLTQRPLHSYYLALLTFWGIALFGGWGFLPAIAPLPSWIPALSAVMAMMLILPVSAAALNIWKTLGAKKKGPSDPVLTLMKFAGICFVLSQAMAILGTLRPLNQWVAFTYFQVATVHWAVMGFFVSAVLGAIYFILPSILNLQLKPGQIRLQVLTFLGGTILYGLMLIPAGIVQGVRLQNPNFAFAEVIKGTMPFLYTSTIGSLLIAAAGIILLMIVAGAGFSVCKTLVERLPLKKGGRP